jgi:hypothetical protein
LTSCAVLRRAPSANWGQIISCYWFYPANIGNYWQLFAIIAIFGLRKVMLLLAIIAPCSTISYCALFAIIDIIWIVGINLNQYFNNKFIALL